jgi:thioredoxin 2
MSTDEKLIVVCPSCDTKNAVPASRLAGHGKCGHCGKPLFQAHPMALTEARFQRHAAESDIPLAVDFWAAWCGPCQMMAPDFDRAAAGLEPRVRLAKVDTEAEQGLGARFGIRSIPTLIVFHKGREIARQSGAMMGDQLNSWIAEHLPA